jgi:protocatechuate 3,4-dioxygenase beta subunit
VIVEQNNIPGIGIRMIRQSIISGRVRDADDEPVQGIPVRAVRWNYRDHQHSFNNGLRQLVEEGVESRTDDQGRFRITSLPPGRYFVYAEPLRLERVREGTSRASLPTFAPNSLELSGAIAVEVFAGTDSVADIRLRKDGRFTVRGTVTSSSGETLAGATVMMLESANTPTLKPALGVRSRQEAEIAALRTPYVARATADAQGNFTLSGVPPGTHRLFATGGRNINFSSRGFLILNARNAPSADGDFAALDVTVKDVDVDGVSIRMQAAGEITFRVRTENASLRDTPQISLIPEDRVSLGGLPRFGSQHKVSPGRYFLDVSRASGHFVKSVLLAGQDVTGKPLYLSGGAAELEVVLAGGAGKVTGRAADREGRVVSGAIVSMWPVIPDASKRNGGAVIATSAHDGSFMHHDLAPGEYYVAAFEGLPNAGMGEFPGFFSQFVGRAERVKVDLNGSATTNLKVIPKNDVERVVAALP